MTSEEKELVSALKLSLIRGITFADEEEILELVKKCVQVPRTGHWIRQTDDHHDYYECEHCGIAVGIDDVKNYCPNCGSRNEVSE